MPVGDLLARVSSRELTEWMAYYEMEPFGEERADLRAGIIASTVANVNRAKGKAYKPQDFMPKFERRGQKTWQEILTAVERMNALLGGRDERPAGG
jgi:hypothetical protein